MFNGYEHKTNRVGTEQTYDTFMHSGYLIEIKSCWTNIVQFEGQHTCTEFNHNYEDEDYLHVYDSTIQTLFTSG